MADELEIPGDRFAVAAWTFRGARPRRQGFICRRFLPGRLLRRLLGFGSFLCNLLACNFHSTLHALTSRAALARFSAPGEVACRRPTASGSWGCRPTAAGCKLAPRPPDRRSCMRYRAMGSWLRGGDCHAHSCNHHRHARCDRDRPHRRDQRVHLDRDQGGDGRIAAAVRARQRPQHSCELCALPAR